MSDDKKYMNCYDRSYVAQGYSLPRGYTWETVAEARQNFAIDQHRVPVGACAGVCAWGVPIVDGRFLDWRSVAPAKEAV